MSRGSENIPRGIKDGFEELMNDKHSQKKKESVRMVRVRDSKDNITGQTKQVNVVQMRLEIQGNPVYRGLKSLTRNFDLISEE